MQNDIVSNANTVWSRDRDRGRKRRKKQKLYISIHARNILNGIYLFCVYHFGIFVFLLFL